MDVIARDDATVRRLGRLRRTHSLPGVLKVILPGADPRTARRQAADDGWEEVFFELATWDLHAALALLD
ncbi:MULTISPECIES: hypothetical protein [Catenuloplanes]|uniref:Uncharacterized protein n=1 Tax=Catenuloplanes niger TaxID=587534 RepID=A0AAE3ZUT0_9ACTN|nr:hypothetical protein [Catenuloplanes niger]MDR7325322.1 hypothetical protein [Catenuloplanes niger]